MRIPIAGAAVNSVQNPAYQAGMEARFAIASRHSRMVRVLRVAVPAAVIVCDGCHRRGIDFQSVSYADAQAAGRHRTILLSPEPRSR